MENKEARTAMGNNTDEAALIDALIKLVYESRMKRIKVSLDKAEDLNPDYTAEEYEKYKEVVRGEWHILANEFTEQLLGELDKRFNIDMDMTAEQMAIYETAKNHLFEALKTASATHPEKYTVEVKHYVNALQALFEIAERETEQLTLDGIDHKCEREAIIYEKLASILPQSYITLVNKLSQEITSIPKNKELIVSSPKAKTELITNVWLSEYDNDGKIKGLANISAYDKIVYNGVISLYKAGNGVITPAMVYRAINGLTHTEYISPHAVEAVKESLDKMQRTFIKIEASPEVQAYKKKVSATIEGFLLQLVKITVSSGGQIIEAYELSREPILYSYAQISGQIASFPTIYLQTRRVSNTSTVIIIRDYLLRQLHSMKSKTFKRNNKIAYDGIYDELGLTRDTLTDAMYKKKTHEARARVEAILNDWKASALIKNWTRYKNGNTIKGITLTLPPDNESDPKKR